MNKQRFILPLLALAALSSCKKDDDLPGVPDPVINEPEQITTVELHFTESGTTNEFEVKWSDPDGTGGNDPVIDDILLDSGKVYEVDLHFYDESGGTVLDLTSEILQEGDEHLVCFEAESGAENAVTITRMDSDGTYPIGLVSAWVTSQKATGELHLVLKHQANGVKDGSCAPGDTDIEIHLNLTIQ